MQITDNHIATLYQQNSFVNLYLAQIKIIK